MPNLTTNIAYYKVSIGKKLNKMATVFFEKDDKSLIFSCNKHRILHITDIACVLLGMISCTRKVLQNFWFKTCNFVT